MGRRVQTAYEARSERPARGRTVVLAGAGGLIALSLMLLALDACRPNAATRASAEGEPSSALTSPGTGGSTDTTLDDAARAAAEYVVAVNDADLLNDPAAQRALVEQWVAVERQRSWLADLQLTQGTIASTITEAGADPDEMLVRSHPLGYHVEQLDAERVRVEVWQLYAILGPGWPGLSGSATTELVMRRTAGDWWIEDGDEITGPDLPGLEPAAGTDTGALARDIESFTPFRP